MVNPTILLKETNEDIQAVQEPSPFSTENNFAAQLNRTAGMGGHVPGGDSVAEMMVTE